MLDPRQDQALQDLARSIARSVDTLGTSCTARLLGAIALGLVDGTGPDNEQNLRVRPKRTPALPHEAGRYTKHRSRRNYAIRTDPQRRRNRP